MRAYCGLRLRVRVRVRVGVSTLRAYCGHQPSSGAPTQGEKNGRHGLSRKRAPRDALPLGGKTGQAARCW